MRSSSREIDGGTDRRDVTAEPPKPSSFIAWWTRHFRGDKDQVVAVRHWLEDLLPECPVRADLLLLASDLCTNAIVHSRSGEAGGQFSVDIDWAPALARVVVGDQGSAKSTAIAPRSGDAVPLGKTGRGLLLVNDIADRWGTASRVPGPTNAHGLICAPTRDSLIKSLVRVYPRAAK